MKGRCLSQGINVRLSETSCGCYHPANGMQNGVNQCGNCVSFAEIIRMHSKRLNRVYSLPKNKQPYNIPTKNMAHMSVSKPLTGVM